MDPGTMALYGVPTACAVLVYLRIVSTAVQGMERELAKLEAREKRVQERLERENPIEVQPAA